MLLQYGSKHFQQSNQEAYGAGRTDQLRPVSDPISGNLRHDPVKQHDDQSYWRLQKSAKPQQNNDG